jgi:hypothetical protein
MKRLFVFSRQGVVAPAAVSRLFVGLVVWLRPKPGFIHEQAFSASLERSLNLSANKHYCYYSLYGVTRHRCIGLGA